MRAETYIRKLASSGIYFFTTAQALESIGGSLPSVRAKLRRLKLRGEIAEPVRSVYVIVSPEYAGLGCLPAEQFIDQLMRLWGQPYYVGLLSAAERHGAAHQRPQATQVVVRKNRPEIHCGGVRITFIARADLEKMPYMTFNTPRGILRYSTPESTALELVGYPNHSGGLDNIATVLAELSEKVSISELRSAATLCPISWSQRLGYLLELIDQIELSKSLIPLVQERAKSFAPLRRAASTKGAKRNRSWKLLVNHDVEPEV